MLWERYGQGGSHYEFDLGDNPGFWRFSVGPWQMEATTTTKDGKGAGRDDPGQDNFTLSLGDVFGLNNPGIYIRNPGLYLVVCRVVSGFVAPSGLDASVHLKHTARLEFAGLGQDVLIGGSPEGGNPYFGPGGVGQFPPPTWPWGGGDTETYPGPSRSGYFASHSRDVTLPSSVDDYSLTIETNLTGIFYASESDRSGDPPDEVGGGWGGGGVPQHYGVLFYAEELDMRAPYDHPDPNKVIYAMGDGGNMLYPGPYYQSYRGLDSMQLHLAKLDDTSEIAGAMAAQTTRKTAFRLR